LRLLHREAVSYSRKSVGKISDEGTPRSMETGNKPPDSADHGRREDLVASLSRAVSMRESQHAARDYDSLTKQDENFRLAGNLQHDLARLLELGNEPRLALLAYEQILAHDPANPMYKPALKAAGHLSYRLKNFKKCRRYLEKFLETNPPAGEAQDADSILSRLPDGKGTPRRSVVAEEAEAVALPPQPQPKLEDSTGVKIELQDMATESNFEDLIAIGNVKEPVPEAPKPKPKFSFDTEIPDLPPAPPKAPGHQAPAAKLAAAPPPMPPPSARKPEPTPAVDSLDPPSFFGAPEPIQADSDVQSMMGFDPVPGLAPAPPEALGETPPLTIGARDIVRKMGDDVRDLKPEKHRKAPGDTTGWARDRQRRRIEVGGKKPNLYERLRHSEFAMLLPVGEKIILDQVVEALRAVEGLSEADARLAVLERKGLLREGLSCDEVVEIWPKIRRLRQKFEFVTLESAMRPSERQDVHHVDVLKPGLRMNSAQGVMKTKWEEVRMVSCGRLDRQPCVDVYAGEPLVHYRLLQGTMDFNAVGGTAAAAPAPDPADACKDFLEELQRKAPDAVFSHTAKNFLSGKNWRPQKFPEASEYDRYNKCLLYAHFGEQVDARALCDAAASAAAV